MLGVRLDPEMEERLNRLVSETGRTKSYYAKLAIQNFLEDREDYLIGLAALEKKGKTLTIDEVKKQLDLED